MVWKFLIKHWKFVLIIILALSLFGTFKVAKYNHLKYIREKSNVDALLSEIQHSETVHGEDVSTIKELQLTVKELRAFREEDIKTIKELQLRPPQIKEIVKTVVKTKVEVRDSLVYVGDSCFEWNAATKWWQVSQHIDFTLKPTIIDFKMVTWDSISHYLYKVPKFKIFGIRFGVSHYEIKCVNHNPDSRIIYNEWINVSKKKGKRLKE